MIRDLSFFALFGSYESNIQCINKVVRSTKILVYGEHSTPEYLLHFFGWQKFHWKDKRVFTSGFRSVMKVSRLIGLTESVRAGERWNGRASGGI